MKMTGLGSIEKSLLLHPDIRFNGKWTVTDLGSGKSVIPSVAAEWEFARDLLFAMSGVKSAPVQDGELTATGRKALHRIWDKYPDGVIGYANLSARARVKQAVKP
jgi:hypothetical protein